MVEWKVQCLQSIHSNSIIRLEPFSLGYKNKGKTLKINIYHNIWKLRCTDWDICGYWGIYIEMYLDIEVHILRCIWIWRYIYWDVFGYWGTYIEMYLDIQVHILRYIWILRFIYWDLFGYWGSYIEIYLDIDKVWDI